ncbi:Cupredoxin [Annulohypoxylon bovei var. microspora]|nr:Cupredoxin [Annulohypoxylon bovei var. microspora]
MDITNFVVSARNQALLYGDYNTYHRQLVKKLHNCRKRLNIVTKNRGKFSKKETITAEKLSENHEFLHLQLLTAERAWAHAMRFKAVHSADTKGIAGRTRSHIISRLDKGARAAEDLVQILSESSTSGASDTDILEARAYASMIRGATQFEKQSWEACLRSYATARIIYIALTTTIKGDIFKDLLSETIDPSIRYAAYQSKVPRTLAIPTIARKAFPSSDSSLVEQINKLSPDLLKTSDSDTQRGQVGAPNAPQTITWRSREVKIEDAAIAIALASTDTATSRLAEKLASSDVILPKEMAAAYDEVLIASQDAADATKRVIDELKEEGVSQNDPRVQSLQITRTAVNYQMISWRIGRNRVLSGEHDGALLDSAPTTTRKSKKDATSRKPKIEPTGRKISRLKDKIVLYDSTLQSIDSIKELPGVAADEGLLEQLNATAKYFYALKSLSIARSHSLTNQSLNALVLTKHAFDEGQQSAAFFSKHGISSSENSPRNIEIRQLDIQFLHNLLKGELQRCRAIVEIDNLRQKATNTTPPAARIPLVQRLFEYPAEGVDLKRLVDFPPKVDPIPVKPLFFDVAWNYIDYPGKAPAAAPEPEERPAQSAQPQKKGWFGLMLENSLWPSKAWESTSDLPLIVSEKCPRRTVSLRVFVSSLICLFVIALALGLGLGLKVPRDKTVYATPPTDYNSYYGVPKDLEFVSIDKLINRTELELDTGFIGLEKSEAGGKGEEKVREYVFNVSQALAAPDGFRKPMILVNGQSPGPLIEANVGDTIRVRANNLMANRSTSIHWHGINQKGSPWMDGVTGISQCGIPPGRSFTYEFRVDDQRGTFWWHAHSSVQYSDGAYGAIVIRDPGEMVPKTDDEKLVFLSDVYHTYGSVILDSYLNPTSKWAPTESGVEPLADNILMNGQNTYNCSIHSTTFPPSSNPNQPSSPSNSNSNDCTGGQLYKAKIHPGHTIRLRLINASSFFSYWFSIDNHTLSIVELDGVEIEPISARGVYLNLGQRVSVILTADQTPGSYYVRASIPRTCFLPYSTYTSAGLEDGGYGVRGVLSYTDDGNEDEYDDESENERVSEPIGVAGNTSNPYGVENNGLRGDVWEGCDDMPFDMPVPMRRQPAVDVTEANMHYIEYAFRQAQEVNRIFINKTSYSPLPHNATLWKAVEQNFTADKANSYNSWDFGLNQQVLLVPDADQGAQIVINSRDAMEHPWHLHGHTFQVVGWGRGPFGSGTTWNLVNPLRRDTVTVPPSSHVVIRFAADNPGVWALHCHVAWHVEGGMFLTLAERPSDLVRMVGDMDPETKRQSQDFCSASNSEGAKG